MAEEVKIVDVAGGPAAEATLQKLLETMQRMEKSSGGTGSSGGGAGNEVQKTYNQAVQKGTKTRKENTKAVDESTSAINRMSQAAGSFVGKAFGLFTGIIGAGIGVAQNLFEAFGDGTGTLTDMIKTVPLFGGLLAKLTGPFDDTLKQFQSIASSGASFNNSITEMRAAAAGARVSLESFTSFMADNTEKFAAFGGTVTQGAQAFGRARKAMRAYEGDLLAMGLTFEEINEGLADYMYLNRAGSRAQAQDQALLAQHSASYTKNLMTLSKLTGEDVKSQREKLAAQQADIAFQMRLARLSPEERAKVQEGLAEAMAAGGETGAEYFKQQFLGMPPLTRATQMFEATMGGAAEAIRRMHTEARDSGTTLAQFREGQVSRLADFVEGSADAANNLESVLMAAGGGLEGPASEIADIFRQQGKQFTDYLNRDGSFNRQKFEQDVRAAQDELNRRDELTQGLTEFQSTLRDIREKIELNIIGPIGQAIGPQLRRLAASFQEVADGGMSDAIEFIGDAIQRFSSDISNFGFGTALQNLMSDIGTAAKPVFESMIDSLKAMIFGQSAEEVRAEQQQLLESLEANKSDIQAQIDALKTELPNLTGANADAANAQIAALESQLGRVETQIGETNTAMTNAEGTSGILGGVFDALLPSIESITTAFSNLDSKTLLIIGAGALGLVGVAVALKAIAGPAALVMGSLGLAAGGLGFMFMGVSAVIDSFTTGVGTLADGLDKLSKIDGSNLSVVGDGIGAIAPHLTDLAVGGVVASFISDGTFEKLAAGITALNGAQTGNMATVGVGLDSVQAALLKFSASAILTNFVGGNALQDITAGIDALNNAKTGNMATVAAGLDSVDVALAKFAAASFITNFVTNDALTSIATGITALDGASVANMATIAAGMDAVAVPLAKFAAGGILASLMSDTALQDLAAGITAIDGAGITNIPLVAAAMEMLSGPLVTMAGTGVLLRFIGDNSFGNLATQLSQFESLNPQTLHEVGPALKALNEGIQAFTGGSILESLGGAISGFFSGLFGGDEYEDLIEDLKKFEEVNTRKIYEVGQGLQGIANFVGGEIDVGDIRIGSEQLQRLSDVTKTLDSDSINSYNRALEALVETLKELTEELGENAGVQGESNQNVATLLSNLSTGSNETTAEKLDQLNSTMTAVLMTLQTSGRYTRQTRDAARAGANDLTNAGF
jgi:hypothetical protein